MFWFHVFRYLSVAYSIGGGLKCISFLNWDSFALVNYPIPNREIRCELCKTKRSSCVVVDIKFIYIY